MPRSAYSGDSVFGRDGSPAFDRSRIVAEVAGRNPFDGAADSAHESPELRPDGDVAGVVGE